MNPLVSILVLTYEQKAYIEQAMRSLADQEYSPIEFIVVDDASTDGTREWLVESVYFSDKRFSFLFNEQNIGINKSLNLALQKSKGRYLSIFSADDILLPPKVAQQVAFLEKQDEHTGLVYSDAAIITKDGLETVEFFIQKIGKRKLAPTGNVFRDLVHLNFIPTPSVLIKKEVFEKVGTFSEDLFIEDYDLWLRAAQHYSFAFSNESYVQYRIHDANHISSISNWNSFKVKAFDKLDSNDSYLQYQLNRCLYYWYQERPEEARKFYLEMNRKDLIYRSLKRLINKNKSRWKVAATLKVLSLFKDKS